MQRNTIVTGKVQRAFRIVRFVFPFSSSEVGMQLSKGYNLIMGGTLRVERFWWIEDTGYTDKSSV